jgi:hypothetical protein
LHPWRPPSPRTLAYSPTGTLAVPSPDLALLGRGRLAAVGADRDKRRRWWFRSCPARRIPTPTGSTHSPPSTLAALLGRERQSREREGAYGQDSGETPRERRRDSGRIRASIYRRLNAAVEKRKKRNVM